jgi:1-acyl-sn-glycerol-3-phosphate acyltransferase
MYDYPAYDPRDRETFYFHATPLRRLVLALARILFKPVMRLEIRGLGNLPVRGGFVLASNHLNNWDVFAMQLATPRTIFYMGKAELFRFAPLGAAFRNFGAFPVYRGEKDAWALRHARRVLEAGQVLGMFPEGHRSHGEGLLPAKTGSARLAIEAQCPVVPMAISGTERFLRDFPRRTHVSVTYLPQLVPQPGDTPESLTERMMLALASALPEPMRGVYAVAARS